MDFLRLFSYLGKMGAHPSKTNLNCLFYLVNTN